MERSGATLGGLIHLLRRRNGWTLREMSAKVGIPLSTLAKVEADKLSLTYDKLQPFADRVDRSLTTDDNSIRITTPNYDYEYLCADLREKRMVPILTRIRAHNLAEFGEPVQHRGEEFIYVLEGSIEVHLQFYTTVTLKAGQGIYIDSTMGHAYVAKDCESALVLGVCSGEEPDLDRELISLVEDLETPEQGQPGS